jgi:hypothetical protein
MMVLLRECRSMTGENRRMRARASWRRWWASGLIALALALAACSPGAPNGDPTFDPISSTFDADTEGWTSSEPMDPTWQAPGYLELVDDGPDWYHAIAPVSFHGDWTGATQLSFDVLADDAGVVYPVRVVLTRGSDTIYHEFGLNALAAGEWRSLEVAFEASAWRVFAGEQTEGAAVDVETLALVLADVEDFRIRIDLNDGFQGDEVNGLDDVVVE